MASYTAEDEKDGSIWQADFTCILCGLEWHFEDDIVMPPPTRKCKNFAILLELDRTTAEATCAQRARAGSPDRLPKSTAKRILAQAQAVLADEKENA